MDLDMQIALALGMEKLGRLRAEAAADANYRRALELQKQIDDLTPKPKPTRKPKAAEGASNG